MFLFTINQKEDVGYMIQGLRDGFSPAPASTRR